MIRPAFYGVYHVGAGELQAFQLINDRFAPLKPNEHGRVAIPGMDLELGVWNAFYLNEHAPWLRWFDRRGNLIPIDSEHAETETRRANKEKQRADKENRRADNATEQANAESQRANAESRRADALAAQLRSLGIDPEPISGSP